MVTTHTDKNHPISCVGVEYRSSTCQGAIHQIVELCHLWGNIEGTSHQHFSSSVNEWQCLLIHSFSSGNESRTDVMDSCSIWRDLTRLPCKGHGQHHHEWQLVCPTPICCCCSSFSWFVVNISYTRELFDGIRFAETTPSIA